MKKGRPTKFNAENLPALRMLARMGATTAQIAEAFKVAPSTVNKWMAQDREFSDTIKAAKVEADTAVERSLFERATGYNCRDHYFSTYEGRVTATSYTKHYPPDVTACIFWLKNRQPERWREKSEVVTEHHIVDKKLIAAAQEVAKKL